MSSHRELESKLIILGSGPAGLTAAIYAARANLSPILIHGGLPGGQLTTTTEVENFPGFPEGVMGPELMERMEKQAARFGTVVVQDSVVELKLVDGKFKLKGESESYNSDTLILATGASPKYLNIPGELELLGYGVSTCATCDGAFFKDKIISVVGGGDSALEEANFLSRFGSVVQLFHRRDEFKASKIMQDRLFKNSKVKLFKSYIIEKVNGSKEDGVVSLDVVNLKSGQKENIKTDALFVAIGHTPNSNLVKDLIQLDSDGYILPIKQGSTETQVPGLFACGDVQDKYFRQAITAAGSGCMAAIQAEKFLEAKEL